MKLANEPHTSKFTKPLSSNDLHTCAAAGARTKSKTTKAPVPSQERGAAASKPAKKSNYFVDEEDLEDVKIWPQPFSNCVCDLVGFDNGIDGFCEVTGRDPKEMRRTAKEDAVLVNGAPCIIHDYCCRKCHYELIEMHTKSGCVCEQLLRLSGRISQSEFGKRKERNTPFLAKGQRCHHGICCVGCHFKLVLDERREELRASIIEDRRETARFEEEHRLLRKAQRDAKKKQLKREADMAGETERKARLRLERRVEEWDATMDTETIGRITTELSKGAPPHSVGSIKSKATTTRKGTETVDRTMPELSREAPPHYAGKTETKATTTSKGPVGVKKSVSGRAPMSKATTGYDHRTIARDILRAAGIHPTLPPLNAHIMQRPETR